MVSFAPNLSLTFCQTFEICTCTTIEYYTYYMAFIMEEFCNEVDLETKRLVSVCNPFSISSIKNKQIVTVLIMHGSKNLLCKAYSLSLYSDLSETVNTRVVIKF